MTYLLIWITWLAWVPTVLLEKRARGDAGGTSILPVIPLFPVVGCLAAWGLNQLKSELGSYSIGGLHVVLLTAMAVSCAICGYRICRKQ